MVLNYDIAVDLTPEFNRQLSPKFSVSLGDHGAREFTAKILQGGEPYEIEEGSTVSIVGKKSDGHIFAYACTYADEYVYFTIEEQMTPVSGIVTCELSIIDASGNKVGSANFTYWVEPSPVTDGEASESDLQMFQEILDAADDLADVREILDRAVPIAEQIGDIDKLLAAFPTKSASGELLTLTDGADGIPVKSLTLNLTPHQTGSGDPSPENVRPISGYESVKLYRTGKNMLDPSLCVERTQGGVKRKVNADGTITLTGTPTQTSVFWKSTDDMNIPIKAGTYATETFNSKGILRLAFKKAASTTSSVFTLTEDDEIVNVRFVLMNASVDLNDVFSPMLVAGGTIPTDFEPYQGETYNISIPTSAGTVYGGQLTVEQDGSGTLVVDRGFVNLTGGSDEDWRESSSSYYCNFGSAVFSGKTPALGRIDIICNRFIGSPAQGIQTGTAGLAVRKSVMPSEVTSLAEWVAWLGTNNLECAYPLAEPQTYTLTASQITTLLGNNTIFMDADGTIDLAYRADTQKYIDSRISALNSNLAYIEDGQTASRAYSVGQYVLIGGQLYRVTASIASGATFTIGTNVVATTVGTELTALN